MFVVSTRARLARTLPLAVLFGVTACADSAPTVTPRPPRVRLLLGVGSDAAGREVEVEVYYVRVPNERVSLTTARFAVDTNARDVPITVDLTSCVRDADREGGKAGCPVRAVFTLFDPTDGAVDSVYVGPVSITGTETEPPMLPVATLRRTASITLLSDSARVHVGDTITIAGQAIDPLGVPIRGRTLVWASGNQGVASVDASGVVRGASVGQTVMTARREGLTATVTLTVPVTGVQRWLMGPRLGTIGSGAPVSEIVHAVVAAPGGPPRAFALHGSQDCSQGTATAAWNCAPLTGISVGNVRVSPAGTIWGVGGNAVVSVTPSGPQIARPGTNDSYNGVWTSDQGHIFTAGFGGARARFDGTAWTTIPTQDSTASLWDVWGSSPTNVLAIGDSGVVMRWDGRAWSRNQILPQRPRLLRLWGTDSTHVYAVGDWGALWFYNGATWTTLPGSTVFQNGTAIHGTSTTDIYLTTEIDSTKYLMRWNGQSMSTLAVLPALPRYVYAVGDGRVLVSGWDGYVGVYQGGAMSTASLYPSYVASMATSPTHAMVASGYRVWRYDGATWTSVTPPWQPPSFGWLYALAGTSSTDVFGGAYLRPQHLLMHFDGTTWTRLRVTGEPRRIFSLAPNDVLMMQQRWDGARWQYSVHRCSRTACQTLLAESPDVVRSIWGSSPTNIFISGSREVGRSTIHFTARFDGRAWTRLDLTSFTNVNNVWGSDSANVLLSTSAGTQRFNYATGRWTPLPGQTAGTGTLWGTAYDDLYYGNCGNVSQYNGRRWTTSVFADQRCVLSMSGLPGGGAVATAQGSLVLHGVAPSGAFGGGATSRALPQVPGLLRSNDAAERRLDAARRAELQAHGMMPRR